MAFKPGHVDLDVFTNYKSDHRLGVRVSDTLIYQSCQDQRWWLRPSLTTNQEIWTADHFGFQLGTDQLLGPLQIKASYRLTRYLNDGDRFRASTQNVAYLDVMYEKWRNRDLRWESRLSLRTDLDSGRSSLGITIAHVLNHRRGYRDYSPRELLFRGVRNDRAAQVHSTHLTD